MQLSQTLNVVTGAASGIGRAVAQSLAEGGGKVVAVDRDAELLATLDHPGIQPLAVDLTTPEGLGQVTALSGVTHIVNAAGIIQMTPLDDVTEEQWDAIFAINSRALFFLVQRLGATLPRGGAIVNLASVAGKEGGTVEAALYSATKASVMSYTRTFARAWAERGVRVNAVCPGVISTPMDDQVNAGVARLRGLSLEQVVEMRLAGVPMGYAAPPQEVADVILFLLSDAARYMTGQSINVSGGRLMY